MSRVASQPVEIPSGVEVQLSSGILKVKGSKGNLELNVNTNVGVKKEENKLIFSALNNSKHSKAMSGTMRAIVANMVAGVSNGFEVKLQLVGVGYRAQSEGDKIVLFLGYSHPIKYQLPEGVKAKLPTQTELVISGINKQLVGQVAAEIREFRRPEPYKGKGVRYLNEVVRRKEAKKK